MCEGHEKRNTMCNPKHNQKWTDVMVREESEAMTYWRGSGDQPGLVQKAPETLLPKGFSGSIVVSRYGDNSSNSPSMQKIGVRWRKKRLVLAAEFEYTGFLELRTGIPDNGLYIHRKEPSGNTQTDVNLEAWRKSAVWVFKVGDSQVGQWAKPLTAALHSVECDGGVSIEGEAIVYDGGGASQAVKVKLTMGRNQGLLTLFVHYVEGPHEGKNLITHRGADGEVMILSLQQRARQQEDGSSAEVLTPVVELYKHGYRGCLLYVTASKDGSELAAFVKNAKAEKGCAASQQGADRPQRQSRHHPVQGNGHDSAVPATAAPQAPPLSQEDASPSAAAEAGPSSRARRASERAGTREPSHQPEERQPGEQQPDAGAGPALPRRLSSSGDQSHVERRAPVPVTSAAVASRDDAKPVQDTGKRVKTRRKDDQAAGDRQAPTATPETEPSQGPAVGAPQGTGRKRGRPRKVAQTEEQQQGELHQRLGSATSGQGLPHVMRETTVQATAAQLTQCQEQQPMQGTAPVAGRKRSRPRKGAQIVEQQHGKPSPSSADEAIGPHPPLSSNARVAEPAPAQLPSPEGQQPGQGEEELMPPLVPQPSRDAFPATRASSKLASPQHGPHQQEGSGFQAHHTSDGQLAAPLLPSGIQDASHPEGSARQEAPNAPPGPAGVQQADSASVAGAEKAKPSQGHNTNAFANAACDTCQQAACPRDGDQNPLQLQTKPQQNSASGISSPNLPLPSLPPGATAAQPTENQPLHTTQGMRMLMPPSLPKAVSRSKEKASINELLQRQGPQRQEGTGVGEPDMSDGQLQAHVPLPSSKRSPQPAGSTQQAAHSGLPELTDAQLAASPAPIAGINGAPGDHPAQSRQCLQSAASGAGSPAQNMNSSQEGTSNAVKPTPAGQGRHAQQGERWEPAIKDANGDHEGQSHAAGQGQEQPACRLPPVMGDRCQLHSRKDKVAAAPASAPGSTQADEAGVEEGTLSHIVSLPAGGVMRRSMTSRTPEPQRPSQHHQAVQQPVQQETEAPTSQQPQQAPAATPLAGPSFIGLQEAAHGLIALSSAAEVASTSAASTEAYSEEMGNRPLLSWRTFGSRRSNRQRQQQPPAARQGQKRKRQQHLPQGLETMNVPSSTVRESPGVAADDAAEQQAGRKSEPQGMRPVIGAYVSSRRQKLACFGVTSQTCGGTTSPPEPRSATKAPPPAPQPAQQQAPCEPAVCFQRLVTPERVKQYTVLGRPHVMDLEDQPVSNAHPPTQQFLQQGQTHGTETEPGTSHTTEAPAGRPTIPTEDSTIPAPPQEELSKVTVRRASSQQAVLVIMQPQLPGCVTELGAAVGVDCNGRATGLTQGMQQELGEQPGPSLQGPLCTYGLNKQQTTTAAGCERDATAPPASSAEQANDKNVSASKQQAELIAVTDTTVRNATARVTAQQSASMIAIVSSPATSEAAAPPVFAAPGTGGSQTPAPAPQAATSQHELAERPLQQEPAVQAPTPQQQQHAAQAADTEAPALHAQHAVQQASKDVKPGTAVASNISKVRSRGVKGTHEIRKQVSREQAARKLMKQLSLLPRLAQQAGLDWSVLARAGAKPHTPTRPRQAGSTAHAAGAPAHQPSYPGAAGAVQPHRTKKQRVPPGSRRGGDPTAGQAAQVAGAVGATLQLDPLGQLGSCDGRHQQPHAAPRSCPVYVEPTGAPAAQEPYNVRVVGNRSDACEGVAAGVHQHTPQPVQASCSPQLQRFQPAQRRPSETVAAARAATAATAEAATGLDAHIWSQDTHAAHTDDVPQQEHGHLMFPAQTVSGVAHNARGHQRQVSGVSVSCGEQGEHQGTNRTDASVLLHGMVPQQGNQQHQQGQHRLLRVQQHAPQQVRLLHPSLQDEQYPQLLLVPARPPGGQAIHDATGSVPPPVIVPAEAHVAMLPGSAPNIAVGVPLDTQVPAEALAALQAASAQRNFYTAAGSALESLQHTVYAQPSFTVVTLETSSVNGSAPATGLPRQGYPASSAVRSSAPKQPQAAHPSFGSSDVLPTFEQLGATMPRSTLLLQRPTASQHLFAAMVNGMGLTTYQQVQQPPTSLPFSLGSDGFPSGLQVSGLTSQPTVPPPCPRTSAQPLSNSGAGLPARTSLEALPVMDSNANAGYQHQLLASMGPPGYIPAGATELYMPSTYI